MKIHFHEKYFNSSKKIKSDYNWNWDIQMNKHAIAGFQGFVYVWNNLQTDY